LLRNAPDNRSIERTLTGKTAIVKIKINYRPKNKTWTTPQNKNHKKNLELRLIRP
jgi:hypothetical protein